MSRRSLVLAKQKTLAFHCFCLLFGSFFFFLLERELSHNPRVLGAARFTRPDGLYKLYSLIPVAVRLYTHTHTQSLSKRISTWLNPPILDCLSERNRWTFECSAEAVRSRRILYLMGSVNLLDHESMTTAIDTSAYGRPRALDERVLNSVYDLDTKNLLCASLLFAKKKSSADYCALISH